MADTTFIDRATQIQASWLNDVNTSTYKTVDNIKLAPYNAVGNGVADDTAALNAYWAFIKTQLINLYPSSLPFTTKKFTIPPGTYRITSPLNWTALQAWNVEIEANGVVILGEVNGKSIIDMIGCRGVHMNGLAVLGNSTSTPKSGILIGPIGTQTCGNNKFNDVKILGQFSIASFHNIGSETTRYDSCYFMNRNGYAMAGDGLNALGAVSDYQTLRSALVAVSFTNNSFASCRFENADATGANLDGTYLEGTLDWKFDSACYHLSFQGANVRVVDRNGVNRTGSLQLGGLFETLQGTGVQYVLRYQTTDGTNTALDGLQLDVPVTHADASIIRIESLTGADLTAGGVNFRNSTIRVDSVLGTAPTLFSGPRLTFNGEIFCRSASLINVVSLTAGYGEIFTDNGASIPSTAGNLSLAFLVHASGTLAGQGVRFQLGNGAAVGFQGGVHPAVRAISVNTDADLNLQGQGAGVVRFGTLTVNADAPVSGYITIKDQAGNTRKLAVIT